MSIQDLLELELEGLINTIRNYTSNEYIISYASKLIEYKNNRNDELVITLSKKLYVWYSSEIELIRKSDFTSNKESHEHSIEILEQILSI